MYRRFGNEVTIIDTASHLAQHEDEDVSIAIQEILEGEGIHVRLNATCIAFSKRGREVLAHVDCASGDPEVSGSHILLAVGRLPNTDDLDLTEAAVAVDKRGYIVVDDQLQTSVRGVWALGDCNGKGAFTHTAFNDADLVGAQGFMKIIEDAQTREILGAAILGAGGDEAIHSILDMMYARAPYTVIQRAVHIHPTVSQVIPTMLGELQRFQT